ncbi:MAG: hypothetical protein AAGE65_11015 [Planctomycetota bacterium]
MAACAAAAFACAAFADPPNDDGLAPARAAVGVALDTADPAARIASLQTAAAHYRAALTNPDLPPRDARHARRALRAIDALLRPAAPPVPEPAAGAVVPIVSFQNPAVDRAPMQALGLDPPSEPAVLPPPPEAGQAPPPSEPMAGPVPPNVAAPIDAPETRSVHEEGGAPAAPVAKPSPAPPPGLRRTLVAALALLEAEPGTADPWRRVLTAGANPRGRFGPGLAPPPAAGDALHTLIAVTALHRHGPLAPRHADALAATLLREQSPSGGWRDPLAPADRPGDQALPTAANLLTLRQLAATPGLSDVLRRDLAEAQRRGRVRLVERHAQLSATPDAMLRPCTFSDDLLQLVRATLNDPRPDLAQARFRTRLTAMLRTHLHRPHLAAGAR